MDIWVDEFGQGQLIEGKPQPVTGFFVRSTAPIDMEEDEYKPDGITPTISDVVESLYQNTLRNDSFTGLTIQIHGYNTGFKEGEQDGVRGGWEKTWADLNQKDVAIYGKPNSFVYLGYRWPSENVPSNPKNSVKALPRVLTILLYTGLFVAAIGLLLLLAFSSSIVDFIAALLIVLGIALSMIIGTLFILRIIVYFRDSYRATNFGVPDLVEFIRQLDLGLVKRRINDSLFETVTKEVSESWKPQSDLPPPALLSKAVRKTWEAIENKQSCVNAYQEDVFRSLLPELKQGSLSAIRDEAFLSIYASLVRAKKPAYTAAEIQTAADYWNRIESHTPEEGDRRRPRIRLTFIGHSMGGFVTTQVIRILSDVFDPAAIGDSESLAKQPPSYIGRVFSLGRLILISPDIPITTITSGRTNFLRSSLRRFEEAYLFSNEGDLALRLASTTANYFSFPASTRNEGSRLGNVTVNLRGKSAYGIINLQKLLNGEVDRLLDYIGVQTLNNDDKKALCQPSKPDPESIADLFTYFDCTEYRDLTTYKKRDGKEINVLIDEKQKSPLSFSAYLTLLKAYIRFSKNPDKGTGVDVHGGYFYGYLSNLLIYRLAFLGFQGLLDSLVSQPSMSQPSIEFHQFGQEAPIKLQEELKQSKPNSREQREVALKYLSWLCEQRKMQVAASPERYKVDVCGQNRADVRAGILKQECDATPALLTEAL